MPAWFRTLPLFALNAALAVCAAARAADEDRAAAVRAEFVSALAQAQSGSPPSAPDSAALRAYVLYPYVQAARLRARLQRGADDRVDQDLEAFEQRHADEPVGSALRRDWLRSLAERRQWARLVSQYRAADADSALRCDQFQARIALGQTQGLAPEATALWLTGRELPDECDAVFDWMRQQQLLTPALIESRARAALAAGDSRLARQLARELPPELAAPLVQWAGLLERPQPQIDALIDHPEHSVEPQALLAGWMRLARGDPQAALERFQPLVAARQPDPALASRLARALALGLAWDRRPQALDYFARVAAADYDTTAAEWETRAALWAGDWARAGAALARLPEADRALPRWRYWQARVAQQLGQSAAAQAQYATLAADDNYYAVLAALRLDQAYAPHPQPLALDAQAVARLARLPAFQRAHELYLCDLPSQAAAEWWYGYDSLPPPQQRQAVGLAREWGWYAQAIASASRQRVFDDYALLYPRPYDAPVASAARAAGLSAELLYAVLRQESLYDAQAVSRAGALGLMQLMPDTARRVARRARRPAVGPAELFDPAVNIALGAAHLRELLDLFGGQLPLAIAAYNAGANPAARWLPDTARDADVWIENIPYNETREYVQRVLWHMTVFAWLERRAAQKPAFLLARIEAPTVPAQAPSEAAPTGSP
jgi:soluble lytic murein transglycosylase